MGAGQHELASIHEVGFGKLRLKLVQIAERLSIVLHPVERGAQQQIGIIEVFRWWSGGQESTQDCGRGFRIAFLDQMFGLVQDRWIRRKDFHGICRLCLARLSRHEADAEHQCKSNGDHQRRPCRDGRRVVTRRRALRSTGGRP